MELHILLDKLKENGCSPQLFGWQDQSQDLLSIRILEKDQSVFEPSTLYLTTPAPSQPSISDCFTLFCCGEPIDFSPYKTGSFSLLYFGNEISREKLFNLTMEHLWNCSRSPSVCICSSMLYFPVMDRNI